MPRYLLLVLLTLNGVLYGQKTDLQRLNELKKEIKNATYYDSATVFQLGEEGIRLANKLKKKNEIGWIYQYYGNFNFFSSNYEIADKYYKKSIDIAEKTKDYQLRNATQIRVTFIELEADVIKAESSFRRLLHEAKQKGYIENEIEIYNGLGIMYEMRLQDDKSIQCYQSGLRLSEKYHMDYFTSFLLNNLGLLKLENKQYSEAKKDLERALVLSTKANASRLRFNVLVNLGILNKQTNDLEESISHYEETVEEAKKIGFPPGIVVAYINLGSSYLDAKKIKKARQTIDETFKYVNPALGDNFVIAAWLLRGLVAVEEKDFSLSANCIETAEKLLKNYPDPSQRIDLLQLKAKHEAAQGNFKEAYKWEQEFNNFSDSIRDVSNEQEMNRLQWVYGKERLENELVSVNQKNTILKTENELKSTNMRLIIILSVSLFLIVVGGIFTSMVWRSRKVKSIFSQKLIEQIDHERSRISKDLHDDIGQSLAVVKSKLNLFETGKIDKIEGVDLEIGEILEQTRLLSHKLHPGGLEKIGLERSLNALIDKTQSGTTMICSFEFNLNQEELPIEVSSQIYRIIQECISNTIKHAKATALKVSCFSSDKELVVEYRDNGIGFSESVARHGLGLLTIKERVKILGGKLDIKTGMNKGVFLTVTI